MSICFFFFKQKTAYEMRISEWSSDVCSSDLFMRRADRQQCLVLARRQSCLGGLAFAECRELTQRIAKAGQRLIIGVSKGLVVVHGISHTARQRLKNVAVRYKRHAIPNKG